MFRISDSWRLLCSKRDKTVLGAEFISYDHAPKSDIWKGHLQIRHTLIYKSHILFAVYLVIFFDEWLVNYKPRIIWQNNKSQLSQHISIIRCFTHLIPLWYEIITAILDDVEVNNYIFVCYYEEISVWMFNYAWFVF